MFLREVLRPLPVFARPEAATAQQATLRTLAEGDLAHLIASHLDTLDELAALLCSLAPAPAALHRAATVRGAELLTLLPLRLPFKPSASIEHGFAECALWPVSVPACRWRPPAWVATLRAPPYCRVAGSGSCSHGLCQKQECAKPGVERLLTRLASEPTAAHAARTATAWLALEAHAWLLGALGRNDEALALWAGAAEAGSARAQLDVGQRRYSNCEAGAAAMLRRAVEDCALPQHERALVAAKAHLLLGLMHLDGDGGAEQSDGQAVEHLRRARGDPLPDSSRGPEARAVAALRGAPEGSARHELEDEAWAEWQRREMRAVRAEAQAALEDLERFTFYANGRP